MWLCLQASSQAEGAVERQTSIRETPQASTVCISWSMPKVPAALPEPSAAQQHQQHFKSTCRVTQHALPCSQPAQLQ